MKLFHLSCKADTIERIVKIKRVKIVASICKAARGINKKQQKIFTHVYR